MANIFLHIYEKAHIEQLIGAGNIDLIQKLAFLFRYQDDLIIFGSSFINEVFF